MLASSICIVVNSFASTPCHGPKDTMVGALILCRNKRILRFYEILGRTIHEMAFMRVTWQTTRKHCGVWSMLIRINVDRKQRFSVTNVTKQSNRLPANKVGPMGSPQQPNIIATSIVKTHVLQELSVLLQKYQQSRICKSNCVLD